MWPGEAHLDLKSAAGAGMCRDAGPVSLGNCLGDGETKPVSVHAADTLGAVRSKRSEEPLDLLRGNHRAGIAHGETGAAS
jgi:hypothetical protein